MSFTLEMHQRIYDDDSGSHIYIGPDADGLNLVEIRQVEPDEKIVARITMPKEQAALLIDALRKLTTWP